MRRDKRGSVASEFALVAPMLMAMLFGAFEYGSITYGMNSMQFAANVVARDIAVNNLPPGQAQARVRALVPVWMREEVTVQVTQSDAADVRQNVINLRVEVPSSSSTPFSIVSRFHDWTMSVDASFRQELPYVE